MGRARFYLVGLIAFAAVGGCAEWRGELNEQQARRIERRLRDAAPLNLAARSGAGGESVDAALAKADPGTRLPDPPAPPATLDLSVAQLRAEALRSNLDLQVVMLDPAIVRTRISEERAKFDATIFGGARYKRQDLPALDGDLVQFTSEDKELDKAIVKLTEIEQQKEALELDAGVAVPLPTGGAIRMRSVFDERNKLNPQRFEQNVSALKFSFSQPLLRDAGTAVNVASIRIARLEAGATGARTRLSAIRVLAGAEKEYWRAYATHKMLEVRRQQYDLAFDNLYLVRKRVAEGLSPQIEIVRAEVGVVQRLEALIIARTDNRLQQRELKRILNMAGVDLNSSTYLRTATDPQLLRFELDADALAADALANRMELLELEVKLAADAIRYDYARNQALPLFVLDFEYGLIERRGSLGTAWEGMWDFDNSELSIGIRGEIPVTNGLRAARMQQATLTRAQRLATKRQREQAIRQEVFDARDVLEQNWQRILAARQNVIVSGVNYEAELDQFREGLRTMREVLEALTQLGEAQLKEVLAIVAYQVAQIDLAYATGTLLGYGGVDEERLGIGVLLQEITGEGGRDSRSRGMVAEVAP